MKVNILDHQTENVNYSIYECNKIVIFAIYDGCNIWDCLTKSIRFLKLFCMGLSNSQHFKIKNTYFMFSTISMLAKNRTSFKSPVATVEDQLLL